MKPEPQLKQQHQGSDQPLLAVQRVMDLDGKIEEVRGRAAERLNEVDGLGALLHY